MQDPFSTPSAFRLADQGWFNLRMGQWRLPFRPRESAASGLVPGTT
jgi:hypothetical protein